MIPKIIHYFWAGDINRHADFHAYWRKLHPGWIIHRWDDTNIVADNQYLKNAIGAKNWAKVSDYVRLWALREFGGIYLDADVELLKPLDDLLWFACFCGFQSPDPVRMLNSAVIGSEQGHGLPTILCSILKNKYTGLERDDSTGPGIITEYLSPFLIGADINSRRGSFEVNCMVLAKNEFYPYAWNEKFTPDCIKPETIGVHHWDLSWWSGPMQKVNPFK